MRFAHFVTAMAAPFVAVSQSATLTFLNSASQDVDVLEMDEETDDHTYVATVKASESFTKRGMPGDMFQLRWATGSKELPVVESIITQPGDDHKLTITGMGDHGRMLINTTSGVATAEVEQRKKMNVCEQCLHSGWDYCISVNTCTPRGELTCFGPEDHVTSDWEFAQESGSVFVECPKDRGLIDNAYLVVHGHISEKVGTLWKETLTVAEGRSKCTAAPECHGLSVEKEPASAEERVEIIARSGSDIVVSAWTTYIHQERADARSRSDHAPKPNVLRPVGLRGRKITSEDIPSDAETWSGKVRNIVGKNFAEVTGNVNKDVLMLAFAPWCGWSQQFKPIYKKMADGLNHVETLELVQMDTTQNTPGDFELEEFPILVLFRAGENKSEVLVFKKERTPEGIRAWLHQWATHPFSDYPPRGSAVGRTGDDRLDDTDL